MKRPMLKGKRDLADVIIKRLPMVRYHDLLFYFSVIFDLMAKRIIENRPVIIDGFGTFDRQRYGKRKRVNISTKKHHYVNYNVVSFKPHYDLLKMADLIGLDFIRTQKEKREKTNKGKKK